MKSKLLLFAGLLVTLLGLASLPAHAQGVYTGGHGDLGVEYTPGEDHFHAHWHLDAGSVVNGSTLATGQEFEPDELVARFFGTASVNGTVASALGVSAGHTAYRTGISAYPPNLGFALEEVGSPTDWLDESITLTLTGFSGPGQMALSQTLGAPFNTTLVWFSSLGDEYTQANNSWGLPVGGHIHLDWWFSEAGLYEVDFTWEGTYLGLGDPIHVASSGTFGFQVGVIPEPATWGAIAAGLLAGLAIVRRRRLAPASETPAVISS